MEETAPLLPAVNQTTSRRSLEAASEASPAPQEGLLVDFIPDGDPENPQEWSQAYKNLVVFLLAFMSFTVTFTCVGVVPVATRIVGDLDGHAEKSSSVLLVTIWELGEAAGPLIIAPLSELYGRWPVFNAANAVFIACVGVAGFSKSSSAFILARFLNGCAVASNVLNPAIVGDLYPSEQRGSAMSLIMFAPLLGGALGPGIAGAIVESSTWRFIMVMAACLAGAAEIAFFFLYRESYKVIILRKRAARLRHETGVAAYKTAFDEVSDSKTSPFWETIKRPFVIFVQSRVLKLVSIYSGILFSFFYVMSTTLPDMLQDIYKLDAAMTGFSFMTFSFGSAFGVIFCNASLDKIYVQLNARHPEKPAQPENRFPLPIIAVTAFPFIIFAYGLCAQFRVPLGVLLGVIIVEGFCLLLTMIPVTAYVVDAFGVHSASALTAVLITRCLAGTFLPLATDPLVRNLGYGYAFLILAGLIMCCAPIPAVVMRYGERWRQKSVYTRDTET